ncbi:hypothetical protein ACJMK2_000593 [Sinanodonta woodiana]|uniref:Uncharacterized protein n=1 Tax=Sinanodonta woodiana TaxID=1069815 RepID=A0ABD3XT19_SINWO
MATKKYSIPIRLDLQQFFEGNELARKKIINNLLHAFPQYKGNIASFRRDRSSVKLVIWIINHPESIPELKKCLETNDGVLIVEKIRAIAMGMVIFTHYLRILYP